MPTGYREEVLPSRAGFRFEFELEIQGLEGRREGDTMSKILVVEDEKIVAEDIQRRLRNLGYTVFGAASSGEEAIWKAEQRPDVALIDIVLQGNMSDVEVAERIRAQFAIPVIFITAQADEKILQNAQTKEPYEYLVKPFEDREICAAIEIALYKNNQKRKIEENEKRLRNLVELVPNGIATVDLRGVITSCNIATTTLTGFSRDEIVGNHISKLRFLRASDLPRYLRIFSSIIRGKVPEMIGITWYHKDGTRHQAEARVRLLKEEGRVVELLVVTRDITEQKKVETSLRESEEKYRTLFEGSRDAIVINSPDGTFIDVNHSALDLFGYTREEMMQLNARELYNDPVDRFAFQREVEKKGFVRDFEVKLRRKDGTEIDCLLTSAVWKDGNGHVLGYDGVIRDITERKKMEEALRESEEQFRNLFENALIGIYRTTPHGHVTMANPALVHMLGYSSSEEVCQQNLEKEGSVPECCRSLFKKLMENGGQVVGLESVWIKQDGTPLFVRENARAVHDEEGAILYYEGTVEDISERRKAEEQVRISLKEKEILLREVHHRVKNNLQVISSLLNLQSSYVKDNQYRELFKESQNRIKTMALIHEKLYQSENLANVHFNEYVRTLVHWLIRSYEINQEIALKLEVEDVSLGVDTAIPCGLIINELVSNSLKHAFPEKKGEIKIGLRSENETIELIVSDNGVGIPDTVDFRNTETLGLRLVTILAEGQLGGKIRLQRQKGTEFHITFRK